MCQLLGISSNKPVDISFSLREFQSRSCVNYHGFGFSFYQEGNREPCIIKKPDPLYKENINQNKFKFKSKVIIGHVRRASCGDKVHENTHPFGQDRWSFAHNGTVTKIKNWKLNNFQPKGKTDSEYAFCYLLDKIYDLNDLEKISLVLESEACKISLLGKFNFLLTDGEILFAFGDDELYFTERKSPFQFVTLKDTEYSLHLADIKAPDEVAIIVATEPLTKEEKWNKINGLKIFKDGEVVTV